MSESSRELPEIKLALGSREDTRVWRNQVGLAWVGQPPNLTRVTTGLFPGSADLIGLHRYRIQPEDVGCTIAVFLSAEAKAGNAKPRPNQQIWQRAIHHAGGIAFVANSGASAIEQLEAWRPGR